MSRQIRALPIFLSLFIIGIFSCKQNSESPTPSRDINGKWNVVYTPKPAVLTGGDTTAQTHTWIITEKNDSIFVIDYFRNENDSTVSGTLTSEYVFEVKFKSLEVPIKYGNNVVVLRFDRVANGQFNSTGTTFTGKYEWRYLDSLSIPTGEIGLLWDLKGIKSN